MKKVTALILHCVSSFLLVEATVNVCIPLPHSTEKIVNTNKLLEGVETKITEKLLNTSEPIHIDHVDVDINHPAIRLIGTLDDVDIYNLSNYKMCLFKNCYNESSGEFDIFNTTFLNVTIQGNYNLTGDLGDIFDIFGVGDFWVLLTEFSIAMTNFTIYWNGTHPCFPINLDVDFHEINAHFNNIMNDEELEELFDKFIHAVVPDALKIIWGELKDIYDKPIEDAINDLFHLENVPEFLYKMMVHPELLVNRNISIPTDLQTIMTAQQIRAL